MGRINIQPEMEAEEGMKRKTNHDLHVIVPSFFRCPISLDVMTSPVSLCTGVTYDRSNIQRWLDAGHNVCPATMQTLPPSHHLVPNHTLHRLIRHWSSSTSSSSTLLSQSHASSLADQVVSVGKVDDAAAAPAILDPLSKLLTFASESAENRKLLSRNDALVRVLVRETVRFGDCTSTSIKLAEAAVNLLELIARAYEDDREDSNLTKLRSLLLTQPESLNSLARILRLARPNSKISLAHLLQTLTLNSPDSQITVIENDSILTAFIFGLHRYSENIDSEPNTPSSESDELIALAYISCLITLSSSKHNKSRIVKSGAITPIGKILNQTRHRKENGGNGVTEAAVKLLESLCGCVEGRKAVSEDMNSVTGIVLRVLMRVSKSATESGVAVLWGMCCVVRDEKVREKVVGTGKAGMTKVLLVMQSGCEERVKRMCGDLLRLFAVVGQGTVKKTAPSESVSSSCFASYESKTSHIMPF